MKLTDEALERAAEALAVACNGGWWAADYTEAQKAMWRRRVEIAMEEDDAICTPETLAAIRRNADKAAKAQSRAADDFAALYWRDKGA